MKTLTVKLTETDEGVVSANILHDNNPSESMQVLATAITIFLNDTKVLDQYLKVAENVLTHYDDNTFAPEGTTDEQ